MNNITLQGLTPLQVELAQKIWSINDQVTLHEWLATLPQSLRQQAQSLLYLITVECIDQDPIQDYSLAQAVIGKVR